MKNRPYLTRRKAIFWGAFTIYSLLFTSTPKAFAAENNFKKVRIYKNAPPDSIINLSGFKIDDVDNSSFDNLLEASLKRGDKLILIKTHATTTNLDLSNRLNLWIKAWNEGPEIIKLPDSNITVAEAPHAGIVVAPEFFSFIPELMDRLEKYVKNTITWWNDRETRKKRIELLSPYLLSWQPDAETGELNILFYQ